MHNTAVFERRTQQTPQPDQTAAPSQKHERPPFRSCRVGRVGGEREEPRKRIRREINIYVCIYIHKHKLIDPSKASTHRPPIGEKQQHAKQPICCLVVAFGRRSSERERERARCFAAGWFVAWVGFVCRLFNGSKARMPLLPLPSWLDWCLWQNGIVADCVSSAPQRDIPSKRWNRGVFRCAALRRLLCWHACSASRLCCCRIAMRGSGWSVGVGTDRLSPTHNHPSSRWPLNGRTNERSIERSNPPTR